MTPEECRVYWGSHGCALRRGHDGDHVCDCASQPTDPGVDNVGGPPYYGPETSFYGEDVARSLAEHDHLGDPE